MTRLLVTLFSFSLLFAGCKPGPNSQQLENEYRRKLSNVHDLMIVNSVVAVDLCSKHSESWSAAARSRNGDINLAIMESLDSNEESVKSIKQGKSAVELMMQGLNTPPDSFSLAHSKVVSVYGSFRSLVDAASAPSGSLMSYNQSVNRIQEEFTKGINELKVLIP
jgi:hypothetical protein